MNKNVLEILKRSELNPVSYSGSNAEVMQRVVDLLLEECTKQIHLTGFLEGDRSAALYAQCLLDAFGSKD